MQEREMGKGYVESRIARGEFEPVARIALDFKYPRIASQADIAVVSPMLESIESKYDVKIVFASIIGSRSYGIENGKSDYDVRFVFVRPLASYVSIGEKLEVIENKENDIVGFDLLKFSSHVRASNWNQLEWLYGLILPNFSDFEDFYISMYELAKGSISPYKLVKGFAAQLDYQLKKKLSKGAEKPVEYIKSLLFSARLVYSSLLVVDNFKRGIVEYPNIDFVDLLDASEQSDNFFGGHSVVRQLLQLRKDERENDVVIPVIADIADTLHESIRDVMDEIHSLGNSLPKEMEIPANEEFDEMNFKLLKKYDR